MANSSPENTFEFYDAVIMVETFLTSEWSTDKHYTVHKLAVQGPMGRPKGGITCMLKPKFAPFKVLYKSNNALVVKTKLCVFICMYFQPEFISHQIIDEIGSALNTIGKNDSIILAGDLNCRIDIPTQKTKEVLEYLEEEGLSLVNDKYSKTYVSDNGTSTIDLVFSNRGKVKPKKQDIILNAYRKHQPVETIFELEQGGEQEKPETLRRSRKFLQHVICDADNHTISKMALEGNLDEAANMLEYMLQGVNISEMSIKRKAKPWFNATCYRTRKMTLAALHTARETPNSAHLHEYARKKKMYKTLIKETKALFQEQEERRLIEMAEQCPYKALSPRQPKYPRNIPMELWELHVSKVLQSRDTRPHDESVETAVNEEELQSELFSVEEVGTVINSSKNSKACGPDRIYNENLKTAFPMLKEAITTVLNGCIKQGTVPHTWRTSTIRMLYKGKGSTEDPNAYRAIALECTLFKTLTTLLYRRVIREVDAKLPEAQFGFRKGRRTTQAIQCLQEDIETALAVPSGKLHAIFIDFAKAFDSISRKILMQKLEKFMDRNNHTKRLIRDILTSNYVEIDDGITTSHPIEQTTGVLQGDPLSPLLFIVATADIIGIIPEGVNLYMYADDMVLASRSQDELQNAFNRVVKWAEENELRLNEDKTVSLTFRKGGKPATFYIDERPLKSVSDVKYLGIILQTTGYVFTRHIQDRLNAAIRAINDIKHLNKLSIRTALKLFQLKIIPVAAYGLENIWSHLKMKHLEQLEKLKATFLKKALCVSKYTPSRLVYELTGELFFIEELRFQLLLPTTSAYEQLMEKLQSKKRDIWDDFYSTDAMIYDDWKRGGYDLRHVVTRFAVHGFHHKLCKTKGFHHPDPECICELCDKQCDRYHAMFCMCRHESLTSFCNEE